MIAEDYEAKGQDGVPVILASEEANKWIRRMDTEMQPLVGYSRDGYYISWYSYEAYSDEALQAREAVNMYPDYPISAFREFISDVRCDYIIFKRGNIIDGEIRLKEEIPNIELVYVNEQYYVFSCT